MPQENLRKTIERQGEPQVRAASNGEKRNHPTAAGEKKGDGDASIQQEKNRALEQKLREAVKKNREINQMNRILLKAYTGLVCQAKALSRAGLLWHVSRLVEGHAVLIKMVRHDPEKAKWLIKKLETIFVAAGLNDLDRIRTEVDRLSKG